MPLYERFSAPHQLHSTRPADFRLLMPAGKPVSDERAVDVSIKCGCKFTLRWRLHRTYPGARAHAMPLNASTHARPVRTIPTISRIPHLLWLSHLRTPRVPNYSRAPLQ